MRLELAGGQSVSAVWTEASEPFACLVGGDMRHALMTAVAEGLAQQGVSVLRHQFAYMGRGRSGRTPLHSMMHRQAHFGDVSSSGSAWDRLRFATQVSTRA